LKKYFISAPVLHHLDPERNIVVETDTSDLIVTGILSQYDNEGILHLVAYFSRKHLPADINYVIYDKELLAIICTYKGWGPHLKCSPHTIVVICDH
jgi:hypothetical protein